MTESGAIPINSEFTAPLIGAEEATQSNSTYCTQSLQSVSSIDELSDHLGILNGAAPQNSQVQQITTMIDQGHSLKQIKETFGIN